jgi:dTDP-4-dehydrorhamnose reductase
MTDDAQSPPHVINPSNGVHPLNDKRKKMLVIGSSGLVGGNLLSLCSRYPFHTIATFHLNLPDKHRETGLRLDITSPETLRKTLETTGPDCVVNLSAMGVSRCESEPDNAHQLQVVAARDLARACKDYNVRFIHLSTDMVYSGEKGDYYTLRDEPDPISVYGQTKLEGEKAIQATGGDYVIVRSALVLGRGRFRRAGFLDWMVERVEAGEKIPLYTDQLRTPIVVDDLVDVIFALAESSYRGMLLAGGDEGVNRLEIGEKLIGVMGVPRELLKPVRTDSIENPVPLQRDLRLDNTKLKEVVGKEDFKGIEDYFRGLWKR